MVVLEQVVHVKQDLAVILQQALVHILKPIAINGIHIVR